MFFFSFLLLLFFSLFLFSSEASVSFKSEREIT